jgi:AraC family transcriptional regulator
MSEDTGKVLLAVTPARIVDGSAVLMAGLRGRLTAESNQIPAQWERFAAYMGKIPGEVGRVAYGVCFYTGGEAAGCDYLSGVEVTSFSQVPAELSCVNIPAQRYAVFAHREHVSKLSGTVLAIYQEWLPGSGHKIADEAVGAVAFLERFGEGFDPETGMGGMEVWIPIKK